MLQLKIIEIGTLIAKTCLKIGNIVYRCVRRKGLLIVWKKKALCLTSSEMKMKATEIAV